MSNTAFGYPNLADGATLSGGSWSASLPIAKLQTRDLKRVTRSSNAANSSTWFNVTFAKAEIIKLVALCNHNLSLDAKYRIRAYSNSGFSAVMYDSGTLPVWEAFYPTSELMWEDDNWFTGQPSYGDIAGYTWNLTHILTANVKSQYWKIELFDSGNAAGYVSAGRLFMSRLFQPLLNMSWGASIKYDTTTDVSQNPYTGREFFAPVEGARVINLTLDNLTESEAVARVLEMQRVLGIHGELFYLWDPEDVRFKTQRSFLGRLASLSAIDAAMYSAHKTSFEIKELI